MFDTINLSRAFQKQRIIYFCFNLNATFLNVLLSEGVLWIYRKRNSTLSETAIPLI